MNKDSIKVYFLEDEFLGDDMKYYPTHQKFSREAFINFALWEENFMTLQEFENSLNCGTNYSNYQIYFDL